MKTRGLTLIELLLSIAMAAVIITALGTAFNAASHYDSEVPRKRVALDQRNGFEDTVRDLLQHMYVSADTTDTGTYFVSDPTQTTPTTASTGTQANPTGSASVSTSNSQIGNTAQQITFTMCGKRVPASYMQSNETDFETLNRTYGAAGGITEVSLSASPVGTPTNGVTGLFIRKQTPSDSDPTQGGNEELLNADVTGIGFEFYDGTDWINQWDTRTGPRRIPAAVRVTYTLNSDGGDQHLFVVKIPTSDVTSINPYSATTATSTGTTGATGVTGATGTTGTTGRGG